MSHQDYTELIEQHTETVDDANEALTQLVLDVLEERIDPATGDAQIDAIVAELNAHSTEWALAVLPAVVADAQQTADARIGSTTAADATQQEAALQLAEIELIETLHNTAEQMARDARRQIREGLRIRMEEEVEEVNA